MKTIIDSFYGKRENRSASSGGSGVYEASLIRSTMRADWQDLLRRAAAVCGRSSKTERRQYVNVIQPALDAVTVAYHEHRWADFKAALIQAQGALFGMEAVSFKAEEHWIYQGWSRVLDGNVWFVCCEREVVYLKTKGILRSAIYTKAELDALLQMMSLSTCSNRLYAAKKLFNASVITACQEEE